MRRLVFAVFILAAFGFLASAARCEPVSLMAEVAELNAEVRATRLALQGVRKEMGTHRDAVAQFWKERPVFERDLRESAKAAAAALERERVMAKASRGKLSDRVSALERAEAWQNGAGFLLLLVVGWLARNHIFEIRRKGET